MNLRISARVASNMLLAINIPTIAYSLGTEKTQSSSDKSAVIGTLLFFGVSLLVSGGMTVKNKQYGPEEGLRNNYIKGEKAVIWGLGQLFFGVVLVVLGLIGMIF